jgi:hypothetical protein
LEDEGLFLYYRYFRYLTHQIRPPPSESERLIITADELGQGWTGTKHEIDPVGGEGQHPAWVRLALDNGSSYCGASIHLFLYSTVEQTNASKIHAYENMGPFSGADFVSLEDLTIGDRDVKESLDQDGIAVYKLLVIQKGRAIHVISIALYWRAEKQTL